MKFDELMQLQEGTRLTVEKGGERSTATFVSADLKPCSSS